MRRGLRANIGRRTRKTKYNKRKCPMRQRVRTRRSLASYNRLAFRYDPTANYSDDENLDIEPMTTICLYCNALKFKRETAGLCCASGKVKFDPLLTRPQPLKPLFDGSDPDSSDFLQHILEYNNCFRMTFFGANIIRKGGFMQTYKIQGQIYIDCTPTGEQDVAAIIVGNPTKSRDIVVQRRINIKHRVNENDALQYPIIYWHGQGGYDITL